MPIYEYQCTSCGHELEAFQKMSDAPLTECPKCHEGTLKKLVSVTSFQLKGTGWYATDFRDKGKQKPETKEGGESGSSGSGGDESGKKSSSSSETKTNESKGKDAKAKDAKSDTSSSNKNSSAE